MGNDVVVAGSGVWGCTLARRLAEAGRKVLVLEKRAEIGGNCRCEIDPETGIEIHTYGSHIFHTHNRQAWDFVRRFTEFNGYQHKVLANYKGKVYHLPLGLTLINKFFGVELKPGEVEDFLGQPVCQRQSARTPTVRCETNRDALFEAFFRGYTSKQWGKAPEEIDPSIIKRVPVRNNYDTNYFNDYWQGIPADGYNKLFERLLNHENIKVECNVDFNLELATKWAQRGARIFYSGPLDRLFNYKFGALPWRSLRFEREMLDMRDFQGTSVVNYTEAEVPYTRIHEFKHYHPELVRGEKGEMARGWGFDAEKTVIMREYSKTWEQGDEPYYPINNPESSVLLAKYQEEVKKFNLHCTTTPSTYTSLVVGGRLGGYKYYDMDQAMAAALALKI